MKIAPSLMSLGLLRLEEGIRFFNRRADLIHVDIMDGHFVKNITLSPLFIRDIREITQIPIEAHLMLTDPEILLEACVDAGADIVTMHAEAVNGSAVRLMQKIHDTFGRKVGLAVNPETPFGNIEFMLPYVDMVTFMTIDPGFAGTKYIPAVLSKVERAVDFRAEHGLSFEIQVDGSIGEDNYAEVAASGADIIVAGEPTLFNLDQNLERAWEKMLSFVEKARV